MLQNAWVATQSWYVLGAFVVAMVFFGILAFFRIRTRWIRLLELVVTLVLVVWAAAGTLTTVPEPVDFIIQKGEGPKRIVGEVSVRVKDVVSLRGWGEGGPEGGNSQQVCYTHGNVADNAEYSAAFGQILGELHTSVTPSQLARMSQAEWGDFLLSLKPAERDRIGAIEFAYLRLDPGSGHSVEVGPLFQGDEIHLSKYSDAHGRLRVLRIFNTPERISGVPEAILLGYKGD